MAILFLPFDLYLGKFLSCCRQKFKYAWLESLELAFSSSGRWWLWAIPPRGAECEHRAATLINMSNIEKRENNYFIAAAKWARGNAAAQQEIFEDLIKNLWATAAGPRKSLRRIRILFSFASKTPRSPQLEISEVSFSRCSDRETFLIGSHLEAANAVN